MTLVPDSNHTGTPSGAAAGDLAGSFPSPLLAAYRTMLRGSARAQASAITGAGTYYVPNQGGINAIAGVGGAVPLPFYIQPTDWAAAGFTTSLRLLVGCLVTDTAPAITCVFGLYPVTAWAGGTTVTSITVGAVTAGSTVTFATPAANSLTAETSSGNFGIPAAGYYIVGMTASGAAAANSNPTFPWALQVRNA